MRAGISESTRPAAAKELDRPQDHQQLTPRRQPPEAGRIFEANVRGDSSSPCMRQWVPRPAALLVRDPTAPAVPIDLAPWSGLLLPQNAAEVVKLQDSGYFFGWDDYLACFRLRCAGFQIEAVPAAVIGNERASGDDWLAPWRAYYLTRNRVLFLLETRWVSWPAVLLVEGRNFRRAVAACRLKRAAAIARGMFDGLMNRRGPRMMPS
jgi:GT2 family glycosyltransferase